MSQRTCDACGKSKSVDGGRTCETGHFICKDCVWSGIVFVSDKKSCPLCRKPLR
jgi:hypothetical protein